MFLNTTLISKEGDVTDFSFWSEDMNACLVILNHFVSTGNTLLDARLLDEDDKTWTQLPLEAFDGDCLLEFELRSLQRQLEGLLGFPNPILCTIGLPVQRLARRSARLELRHQKIKNCQEQVEGHMRNILHKYHRIQRSQQLLELSRQKVLAIYAQMDRLQSELAALRGDIQ